MEYIHRHLFLLDLLFMTLLLSAISAISATAASSVFCFSILFPSDQSSRVELRRDELSGRVPIEYKGELLFAVA